MGGSEGSGCENENLWRDQGLGVFIYPTQQFWLETWIWPIFSCYSVVTMHYKRLIWTNLFFCQQLPLEVFPTRANIPNFNTKISLVHTIKPWILQQLLCSCPLCRVQVQAPAYELGNNNWIFLRNNPRCTDEQLKWPLHEGWSLLQFAYSLGQHLLP